MRRTRKPRASNGSKTSVTEVNQMEETTVTTAPLEELKEVPTQSTDVGEMVYEGRSQRQRGILAALNRLNANDKDWKYTLTSKFDVGGGVAPIDMLRDDGFEEVSASQSKELLGYELRAPRVLMKIKRKWSEINQQDSIDRARADVQVEMTDENGIKTTAMESKRKMITISKDV